MWKFFYLPIWRSRFSMLSCFRYRWSLKEHLPHSLSGTRIFLSWRILRLIVQIGSQPHLSCEGLVSWLFRDLLSIIFSQSLRHEPEPQADVQSKTQALLVFCLFPKLPSDFPQIFSCTSAFYWLRRYYHWSWLYQFEEVLRWLGFLWVELCKISIDLHSDRKFLKTIHQH